MKVARQTIDQDGRASYSDAFICGAPCRYGGVENTRPRSGNRDLGVMWKCNRRVAADGDRCWQHKEKR